MRCPGRRIPSAPVSGPRRHLDCGFCCIAGLFGPRLAGVTGTVGRRPPSGGKGCAERNGKICPQGATILAVIRPTDLGTTRRSGGGLPGWRRGRSVPWGWLLRMIEERRAHVGGGIDLLGSIQVAAPVGVVVQL